MCALQDVLKALEGGHPLGAGTKRLHDSVERAMHLIGDEAHMAMLLDAATVCFGRDAHTVKCAWEAMYPPYVFSQLLACSIVKVIDGKVWMHHVIKAIVIQKASAQYELRMTRVWQPDQVRA
jgi:hypothetical protein